MKISKISRSLVVVIFVISIVFLGVLDFKMLISKDQVASKLTNIIKLAYIVSVIILVLVYVYIKDKLYKKKVKRNIGLIFRYLYVSIILIVSKFGIVIWQKIDFSRKELISYILITFAIGIVIKKVIFNVSKSDVLSVLATFSYSLLPSSFEKANDIIIANIISLIFFGGLFVLQLLIDELKQRGIKTKKYIVQSIILGVIIGISMIFGINPLVWIIFAVFSMFIASDLDNTHISFPKKMMSSINQKGRENLYKIERININKLLVAICLIFILSGAIFLVSKFTTCNIKNNSYYIGTFLEIFNSNSNINIDKDLSFRNVSNFYSGFMSYSKTFYMFCIIYILFMEILAVALKRRYDTKSTMMKLLFLLILNSVYIFNLNLVFYQPLLTVLFILISIVNTSNIYLNREERIKMLVA